MEYNNQDCRDGRGPTEMVVTWPPKADGNGTFPYVAYLHGWWGLAALNISEEKLPCDSAPGDVEIGAAV